MCIALVASLFITAICVDAGTQIASCAGQSHHTHDVAPIGPTISSSRVRQAACVVSLYFQALSVTLCKLGSLSMCTTRAKVAVSKKRYSTCGSPACILRFSHVDD